MLLLSQVCSAPKRVWPQAFRQLGLLFLLLTLFWPTFVVAQSLVWQELATADFLILFTPGNKAKAQTYSVFVDATYEEIATLFAYRLEIPISLRLYPTQESYNQVNPLARSHPGIVAHADAQHREVAIVLPQTLKQNESEIRNNVRHELTHIVIAALSENRLSTGFQEGIAQYVEQPTAELDQKVAALAQQHKDNNLMPWSDLDDREKVYNDPDRSYPQTLSVVAFLVERFGFAKLRDFLTITARSSGYRSALERAYKTPATELEQQWHAWLPSYLAKGYQRNAVTSYDLGYARHLLTQFRYAEAHTELERATTWLQNQTAPAPNLDPQTQAALLTEAQTLLKRSQDGETAEQTAAQARAALVAGDYPQAQELIEKARAAYGALGDTRQDKVLEAYSAHIAQGQQAQVQLASAFAQAQALQFAQARKLAAGAAAEFSKLGDAAHTENALALHRSIDSTQRQAGLIFLGFGFLGCLISFWSRQFSDQEAYW